MTRSPYLVDTDWLFAHLDDDDIAIIDGSWYLPAMGRDGRAEYDAQHIPGAVFFDIDEIVDPASTLPHTLASPELFARKVGALGISNTQTIVVYDGHGLFSAPRVWWNFKIMGAAKVVILDGGLPAWIADRLPIEAGAAPLYPKLFSPHPEAGAVISKTQMLDCVNSDHMQIVDARPADRFYGTAPEPRAGIRGGHMPGAISLPTSQVAPDGKLLNLETLKITFEAAQIDVSKPVVTTCGSGVTAATLAFALTSLGHPNPVLYDGSWTEWGGDPNTPIVSPENLSSAD
ncbi:MAG: 3-mercaptopyruvate sulfurtransferase [Pseudomonadota bacterium]